MKCPHPLTNDELIRHLERPTQEEIDYVNQHVEQCDDCRERLAAFADEDRPGRTAPVAKEGLPAVAGFEITAELGKGGMSVVYCAKNRKLGSSVALKRILPEAVNSVRELRRFRREAEIAAGLTHPNIVKVYDFVESEGVPYISMELIEGASLADTLRANPAFFRSKEAARLMVKICRAVHFAHEHGVLHLDLKPGNILLDAAGEPHVADFGLARRMGAEANLEPTNPVGGTPCYMPPEQANGSAPLTTRADVYSLGAVLYELLTGKPPFRGDTPLEVLRRVETQDPLTPRSLNTVVSRDLEVMCLKCLRKEPKKRYPSASALAEDLERFLNGEPIHARPIGTAERMYKWARRRPSQAIMASVVLFVALSGISGLIWWRWDRSMRQQRATQVVNTALQEAAELGGRAEAMKTELAAWDVAIAAARRAKSAMESGETDERTHQRVHETLNQLEAGREEARKVAEDKQEDRWMMDQLTSIHALRLFPQKGTLPHARTDAKYRVLFGKYGFEIERGSHKEAAAKLRSSLRGEQAAGLDDWAMACALEKEQSQCLWLLSVAKTLDPDPWRNQLRSAVANHDLETLKRLAKESWTQPLPAATVVLLAKALETGGEIELAVKCLLPAQQQRFQDDFIINLLLGELYALRMYPPQPDEAIHYLTAAVALQKENPIAHSSLGAAFHIKKQYDAAVIRFVRAIELDPWLALAHSNLGFAYHEQGKIDEALRSCNKAIELDPELPVAHFNLGAVLQGKERIDEAIAAYRKAIKLDPKLAAAYCNLGSLLGEKGLSNEWHSVKRNPFSGLTFSRAWNGDGLLQ